VTIRRWINWEEEAFQQVDLVLRHLAFNLVREPRVRETHDILGRDVEFAVHERFDLHAVGSGFGEVRRVDAFLHESHTLVWTHGIELFLVLPRRTYSLRL
jgi:hypothetical protein